MYFTQWSFSHKIIWLPDIDFEDSSKTLKSGPIGYIQLESLDEDKPIEVWRFDQNNKVSLIIGKIDTSIPF